MYNYNKFSVVLKKFRKDKKMTLEEMSTMLYISSKTLNHIELQNSKPTTKLLVDFANLAELASVELDQVEISKAKHKDYLIRSIKDNYENMTDAQKSMFINIAKIIIGGGR